MFDDGIGAKRHVGGSAAPKSMSGVASGDVTISK